MTKAKYLFISLFAIVLLLIIPNISNASTTYTYNDLEQEIEWEYELDDSSQNVINLNCKTKGKTGKVQIPPEIDSKKVISLKGSSLYGGAFQNCTGITEITIPNTITSISSYAFDGCTGLKNIELPESITKIENDAFRNCAGLTSITFSSNLSSIGENAFYKCSGLTNVTIPNSVTTIGKSAFEGCSGIKELTLSDHLTKLTDRTFQDCTGLKTLKIPESVTTIEGSDYDNIYGTFGGCVNLEKILIPDSVVSITGRNVFRGCTKLTIYGNDDMASKDYAENYKINFDYIENWDKTTSGSDITEPTVERILVTYASVMNYNRDANKNMYIVPAEAKLVINVVFSEEIKGDIVPILTIRFGDGAYINLMEGTIAGTTITYIYTVKSTDEGVLTTTNYLGGNIKDIAGNVATLSCPAIEVQYSSKDYIYANGTVTNPNNSGNNNNNNGTGSNNGGGTSGGTSSGGSSNNNGSSAGKDDGTTAKGKIPQTGESFRIISILIVVAGIGIFTYFKSKKLRDI